MRTVILSFVVVAAMGLVVSGCGSAHHPQGAVVGQYRLVGGPAPGVNEPEAGTIWAYAGFIGMQHLVRTKAVEHVNTDSTGHFTLRLEPGDYTLLGAQGISRSVKRSGCGVAVHVTVTASTRSTVQLACSVP
jgi:hypothetical protein